MVRVLCELRECTVRNTCCKYRIDSVAVSYISANACDSSVALRFSKYFGVKKWILKLDWSIFIFPYHLAREYHLDFSLTVVSHYPRDFWFNFFHELFPSKTYRFVAWLLGLGSKGSSTPSIRNCLVKPLNTLPDSWATNCVLKLKLRVDGLAGLP